MKRLLSIVSAAFLTLSAAFGEDSSLSAIRERGFLKVAVFADAPPFSYKDANGEYQGYEIMLAKRLAKELFDDEQKVEFIAVESSARIEALEEGAVDIVLANFTVKHERKARVDFANPYAKASIGILSGSEYITKPAQLIGKNLIVKRGTTAEAYFSIAYPEIKLIRVNTNKEGFDALQGEKASAFAHDNTILLAWALQNRGFRVGVAAIGSAEPIAPAVKKGDAELVRWINEMLFKLGREKFAMKAFYATMLPFYGGSIQPEDFIVEGGMF
ncbi:MAG: transporter substrate-binding domain-containing protein [Helicobacteraceae bacterium]|jgi:polar amino acid transport system substrate-binding protein|nr:transporter substrate-binding domain-containing protein [Helicobacteraceae bacterium]